jgi:hypothetical protein
MAIVELEQLAVQGAWKFWRFGEDRVDEKVAASRVEAVDEEAGELGGGRVGKQGRPILAGADDVEQLDLLGIADRLHPLGEGLGWATRPGVDLVPMLMVLVRQHVFAPVVEVG